MKRSVYTELETNKRAMTLGRIALIGGAHLLIIGGGYLVTKHGSKADQGKQSLAGAITWSSQSSNAQEPTVDAASNTLFDQRAGDLSGYNAGDGSSTVAANTTSSTSSSGGRYAPRRPSDSGSSAPSGGSSLQSADDSVLQPIGGGNNDLLYPSRPSSRLEDALSATFDYTVQSGDSIYGISRRFNVTQKELIAANPGIKANAIRVGQVLQVPRSSDTSSAPSKETSSPAPTVTPGSGTVYTVKAGDSLSRIASRQGVTVAELRAANGLSSDMIRIGQELIVPKQARTSTTNLPSMQHRGPKVTIEAGDTLDKYAAIYNVSVRELMDLNKIENPRLIRIGQVLLIPEKNSGGPRVRETQPVAPQPRPVQRKEPERTLQSLDTLGGEEAQQGLPGLDALGGDFSEEDLEDQPLIPIEE